MAEKSHSKTEKADEKNPLGISRGIYALGNSVKDALIWGTVATVATIALISFARKNGNAVDWAAKKLESLHGDSKKLIHKVVDALHKSTGGKVKLDVSAPVVAAGVAAGWLVGHIVQVPSAAHGWKKAQKAQDMYTGAITENAKLVKANAELIEENRGYIAELQKKEVPAVVPVSTPSEDAPGKSFVDTVKKQSATDPLKQPPAATHVEDVAQISGAVAQR